MSETPKMKSSEDVTSHQTTLANSEKREPCPPLYDSEYRWYRAEVKGKTVWYRMMDGMANFILHWQYRFHNHGDIYSQGELQERDSAGNLSPLPVNVTVLREALRRLRSVHPYIAAQGRQRSELGAPSTSLPPTLRHLNLQLVLAYTIPQSEADIEEWLDEVVEVHSNDVPNDFAAFYRQRSEVKKGSTYTLRFHLWEADKEKGLPTRLVLEQSHVLSDGGGLLTTFDEVASFLALTIANPEHRSIEWGEEVKRLPASLQDAIAEPPKSWDVTKKEFKQIERDSRARMSGKATPPNLLDKLVDRVFEMTLANNASKYKFRRTLNRPLASVVRSVAQTGEMFPLGLLPHAKKPFNGPWSHSEFLKETLTESETTKLLAAVKQRKVTLTPFVEAAMAFATTWVRRQRGLTATKDGWDAPTKVLGSFSNAMNRRDALAKEHQRYLGLAMSGVVTKISAGEAEWSNESVKTAVEWETDPADKVPARMQDKDIEAVVRVAQKLGEQYRKGKEDENWLKYDKATMISAMQAEYMCLSNEAYYPSHPWLSSPGRLEAFVSPSRSIPATTDAQATFTPSHFDSHQASSNQLPKDSNRTLEVEDLRLIGRTNLAQPICHLYSFRGQMVLTVSYPEWLYHSILNGRPNKRHGIDYTNRPNILPLWLSVLRLILHSLIEKSG